MFYMENRVKKMHTYCMCTSTSYILFKSVVQPDIPLNPGGTARYTGWPHPRYVFRGRRGLF